MLTKLTTLALLLALLTGTAQTAPAVALVLKPAAGFEPFSGSVKIVIQPHPSYARVCLNVEGPSYAETGCSITWADQKTFLRALKELPVGEYFLTAYVESTTEAVLAVSSTHRLRVLSGSGDL